MRGLIALSFMIRERRMAVASGQGSLFIECSPSAVVGAYAVSEVKGRSPTT